MAGLAILSALFPALLLYAVNFAPENSDYLRELYPGRTNAMQTILNLGVLGLWLGLWTAHFAGTLRAHRTGDRPLLLEMERVRVEGRRTSPRPAFYAAVICATAPGCTDCRTSPIGC